LIHKVNRGGIYSFNQQVVNYFFAGITNIAGQYNVNIPAGCQSVSQGIGRTTNALSATIQNMSVNHCRAHIMMTE
jgi:hypothetical protein